MRKNLTLSPVMAALLAALVVTTVAAHAPASIVSTSRLSYVAADTEVSDSETTGFDNQYDDTADFGPYAGMAEALAVAGTESCAATATQTSSMDAMSINATGETTASFIQVAFAEAGYGTATSSFLYAFDIDEAGIYQFSADVLAAATGDYTVFSSVALKGPSGALGEISVDDAGSDEILPILIALDPGSYTLEALATIEVNAADSEVSASFNANLIYVSPEPATLALLGFGLIAIVRRRKA